MARPVESPGSKPNCASWLSVYSSRWALSILSNYKKAFARIFAKEIGLYYYICSTKCVEYRQNLRQMNPSILQVFGTETVGTRRFAPGQGSDSVCYLLKCEFYRCPVITRLSIDHRLRRTQRRFYNEMLFKYRSNISGFIQTCHACATLVGRIGFKLNLFVAFQYLLKWFAFVYFECIHLNLVLMF